jgi:uncharacterized protein YceK
MYKLLMSLSMMLLMSGCATSIGLFSKGEKAKPYFGTQFDSHILANPQELTAKSPVLLWIGYPAALLDLPLSIVADTLVLPYMMQGTQSKTPK